MNSFGRIFKISLFGESHGPQIGLSLDGIPAGIPLKVADFEYDINRRKPGSVGTTTRVEDDVPKIISGHFQGFTTGVPLTIIFENKNTQSKDYESFGATPRPGHADFVASKKFFGFEDYRGGGHFSGRLTLLLVAAGVIAKKILKNIDIQANIIEIGGEKDLEKGLQRAIVAQDSVGGIVECRVQNLPIGWGEPFFDSVESLIAHAVFSIPAIRGIEFGTGFKAASMFGSEHNDAILNKEGSTATNHAGGVVGGITNGNELVFRVAVKPTSSTPKFQQSINLKSNEIESFVVKGRHDLCIALRVPVVLEAVTAMVLADLSLISNASKWNH